MEKQFVTIEIAEELKSLGFNEKCLGFFNKKKKLKLKEKGTYNFYQVDELPSDTYIFQKENYPENCQVLPGGAVLLFKCVGTTAPLWQQAIDWFRTKRIKICYYYQYHQPSGKMMWLFDVLDEFNVTKFHKYYEDFDIGRKCAIFEAIELINKLSLKHV